LAKNLVNPSVAVPDNTKIIYRRMFTGSVNSVVSSTTAGTPLQMVGISRPTVSTAGAVAFAAIDPFTGSPGAEVATEFDADIFVRTFAVGGTGGTLSRVSTTTVETEPLSPTGLGSSPLGIITPTGLHFFFVSDAYNLTIGVDNNDRDDLFRRGGMLPCPIP
jgi:hypothetical protein